MNIKGNTQSTEDILLEVIAYLKLHRMKNRRSKRLLRAMIVRLMVAEQRLQSEADYWLEVRRRSWD